MNRHISEQFDEELEALRKQLLEMGGLVERQIDMACRALIAHDIDLADEVRVMDGTVNAYEVAIDDQVIHVIARRQPTATDLRTLICIMKASTDLERMGDESDRIAKMAQGMGRLPFPPDQYKHVREMSQQVRRMVTNVLDAFARNDSTAAQQVIADDRSVDDQYREATAYQLLQLKENPEQAERSMNTLWTLRALERIGDHAKNIGEQVVFKVLGEDVRHPDKTAR
ncbi:MAG: phosphate signaling complex protein PhoU [Pseudomonadota bacterium]